MNDILKNKVIIGVIILAIIIIGSFMFFKSDDEELNSSNETSDRGDYTIVSEMTNHVLFNIDGKKFIAELYIDEAPITVTNFKSLVSESFYDGVSVYKIMNNDLMQMGDFDSEDANYTIYGEFNENGYENNISHELGVLSMLNVSATESSSNHFFICLGDGNWRDGSYATFGKVVYGLDEMLKLADYETDYGTPINDIVIESIQFVELHN